MSFEERGWWGGGTSPWPRPIAYLDIGEQYSCMGALTKTSEEYRLFNNLRKHCYVVIGLFTLCIYISM
jgi:hypothetical protein